MKDTVQVQNFFSILLLILNHQMQCDVNRFNAINIDWSSIKFSTRIDIMLRLQLEFLLCHIVDQTFCVKQSLLHKYYLSLII